MTPRPPYAFPLAPVTPALESPLFPMTPAAAAIVRALARDMTPADLINLPRFPRARALAFLS